MAAQNHPQGAARKIDERNRGPITAGLVVSMFMVAIDTTVINVALPHMQASLSASPETITWIITSFIVSMAVATPIAGWLAARVGLKTMLIGSVTLFTISSVACGLATSLPEMVLFRIMQGLTGGPMMPLSQTALLNINPPERHGRAMALFAMAAVISPIIGPVMGAYLTEEASWRWCFYINVPAGLLGIFLLWTFLPSEPRVRRRFDFLGFGSLTLAVGGFQLMLDRGGSQDWFQSVEIWAEALTALGGFWVYLAHTFTAKEPLFELTIFRDRNFASATTVNFFTTTLFMASLALLPLMMQTVLGYPVMLTGILSIPRGVLMMGLLQMVGRLDATVDRRLMIGVGLTFLGAGFWQMGHFSLEMAPVALVYSSLTQGFGQALLTVPLTTMALATVPQRLRADASALNNLIRSIGGSAGVAVLQTLAVANGQRMHASMAAQVTPDNPVVRSALAQAFSPATTEGALRLNAEITRQATMVAYVDDFRLMAFMAVCSAPMLLLLRPARNRGAPIAADVH
jgi:DHA2 family multidrug resistance protein